MKRWLLLVVVLTSGCGTFSKPPLPKFSTGAAPSPAPEDRRWEDAARSADVIYSSLTKSASAEKQPAWRVIDACQAGGARVALGWAELPSTQQAIFDQWTREEISAEQLLAQLATPQRAEWIQRGLRPGLAQVALGAPRELLRKIRAGEALTAEERAALPRAYRLPPEAWENFVDRIATSPRLRRADPALLYRAHLAAEQIIAENIVRFLEENPKTKLLVFLPNDTMIDPREVADFVAQKTSARQLLLDRAGKASGERAPLLTARVRAALEVVNRAPRTRGCDRSLPAPRLRA